MSVEFDGESAPWRPVTRLGMALVELAFNRGLLIPKLMTIDAPHGLRLTPAEEEILRIGMFIGCVYELNHKGQWTEFVAVAKKITADLAEIIERGASIAED